MKLTRTMGITRRQMRMLGMRMGMADRGVMGMLGMVWMMGMVRVVMAKASQVRRVSMQRIVCRCRRQWVETESG